MENGGDDAKQGDSENKESVKVYQEKILVIMAGDETPTFLATPQASSVSGGLPNHFEKSLQNHVTSEKSEKEEKVGVIEHALKGDSNDNAKTVHKYEITFSTPMVVASNNAKKVWRRWDDKCVSPIHRKQSGGWIEKDEWWRGVEYGTLCIAVEVHPHP
ncbi:unnamed protein product [Sphenostylis stenocarpa]|uniref:Uncharacterized protein n=1 Tax=Sphenostylis stenocarpa TaxID=92480 RepID=A0AA86SVL3_9FABA|nr:unnamed protein product [Sphenostylis stenocarpa]